MPETAINTLARAAGLEPATLGFGDGCYSNENSEIARKPGKNVPRTLSPPANRETRGLSRHMAQHVTEVV